MLPVFRALVCASLVFPASAQHGEDGYQPEVAEASGEPLEALAGFQIPEGFRMELWAAEPLLANPVSFCLDYGGRLFVAETFRLHAGVTDMREHMDWLHDELAATTVEERVAFMRKHEGDAFAEYSTEHERVRLIEDTDGDGKADKAGVYADGFSSPASGIAAGLLARGDDLYYTCIPDLWRLTDRDGNGVAEKRESLHTGYGVKIALLGHDMHGLRVGPDGRLYYSIGDRGLHVEHAGGTIALPDRGAVLRCELDGSDLEVYATGLRNPQELVFDDHGNLFTGDNNSDGGDRARWVYVQRGGDSGWRHHYQYVTKPNRRGPWNAEGGWKPFHPGQPAFLTPPVANFADGPSGLTYYPGAVWGAEWDGTFFLCDFRGAPRGSGVYAFRNEPKGAGFALVEDRKFLWDSLVTDVDFGVDGALWASDWVASWGMTGKGRIWRLTPESADAAVAQEVSELLATGMGARTLDELAALAGHGYRDVRQEAHLELAQRSLAERGAATATLMRLAADRNGSRFARLSGIWGLGVVARRAAWDARNLLGPFLEDPDPEIQAQGLRLVGDTPYPQALPSILRSLQSDAARVRGMAAEALGAAGTSDHAPYLLALLEQDASADPWVRTAAIHALERLSTPEAILELALAPDTGIETRRSLAVVLRRMESPLIGQLLHDAEEAVAAEAARAIHDTPIQGAYPALAELLVERTPEDVYFLRRALAAMRLLHGAEQRARIVQLVGRPELPLAIRREALAVLAEWQSPNPVDPVHGAWRPVPAGDLDGLGAELAELSASMDPSDLWGPLGADWLGVVATLEVGPQSPLLDGLESALLNGSLVGDAGAKALAELARRRPQGIEDVLQFALDTEDSILRSEAYRELSKHDLGQAIERLTQAATEGAPASRQFAVRTLGELQGGQVLGALGGLLGEAMQQPTSVVAVELIEALERQEAPETETLLAQLAADRERLVLTGGDATLGKAIFLENAEAQCLKCHVAGGEGSSQVGPILDGIAERLEPSALLQSLLEPNAVLAEGYENWILPLTDGTMLVGRILEESANEVVVLNAEGEEFVVTPDEIETRKRDVSAMPQGLVDGLSHRQLRDLMAYLQSLE